MDNRYINQLEIIINIFTVINGKIKILLFRRDIEPFKNHWMLPSNLLMVNETIEECAYATIDDFTGIKDIYIQNCNIFSKIDRLPNDRIIACSMIGIIDIDSFNFKKKNHGVHYEWFDIDSIPKTVYDHSMIIKDAINYLKNKIIQNKFLSIFFPSDFTIPELFSIYEQAYNRKLDRRNFRKKLIALNLIEDTGYKNKVTNGRPAKLYRLKNDTNSSKFIDIKCDIM